MVFCALPCLNECDKMAAANGRSRKQNPDSKMTIPGRTSGAGQCHQLKHPTFKGVLYFGKIWLFYAALFVGQPYSGALGQRHCVIDSASPKTASSALLLTLSQSFRRLFVSALKSSCFGSYDIRISSQGCCEPLRFRRAVQIPALLPDLQETSSHRNPEVLHPAYIL